MRKLISAICALVILAAATFGAVHLHSAQASTPFEEESNLVFRKALEEILETEGITAEYITVVTQPVYDLNLDQLGFIYLMSYDDYEGFAIVINATGSFEVAEFIMRGDNPFAGFYGQKVYLGLMMYLIYYDGNFINVETGDIVDEEIIELLYEYALFKNNSDDSIMTTNETIHFVNRTANTNNLALATPAYSLSQSGFPASCVPAAGANIIGYWARFFPNLTDFEVGRYVLGTFMYHNNPAAATALAIELYQRMGTTHEGTTTPQFRAGMTSYVQSRGRNISFATQMIGSNIHFGAVQAQIRIGRPLAIFSFGFNMINITSGANSTTYCIWYSTGNHAMAVFGYNVITYTLANGTQRTDRFLRVATNFSSRSTAFFNIDFQTQIYRVYAVNIF